MEHAHHHQHEAVIDPVDADETQRLRDEAAKAGSTPVGYFLGKAVDAATQRERDYWLGRVDSARYMAKRQAWRDRMTEKARLNAEAEEQLVGTEASLELVRMVGNAVVLRLVPGTHEPSGYSLVSRLADEEATTGHGPPMFGQWVVQDLRMDEEHEFAVVSEGDGGQQVMGPWLEVVIGEESTDDIQAAQQAEAERQYEEHEAAQAEAQRQHSANVAKQRIERQKEIEEQIEAARIKRAEIERNRLRRMEERKRGLEKLPHTAPRHMQLNLRDQNMDDMTLDISFVRGTERPQLYQFQVNGTVLGYPPDGRYSGGKPESHVYRRSVQVPRGAVTTLRVYGVTPHGDAGEELVIDVPDELRYTAVAGRLVSGDVGDGRFGFAARTFRNWGVTEVEGRLSVAGITGVLALFEAKPGNGSGCVWVVAAHDMLKEISVGGIRTRVRPVTYQRGAGYLYRGEPTEWPPRSAREAGVGVTITL